MITPHDRLFLTGISIAADRVPDRVVYPYTIPAIAGLGELPFKQPVTFLVGENGAGKSTLLEAIIVAWGLNPEGGSKDFHFSTRDTHSGLGDALRLSRGRNRARDAFFLRAETYYNVATAIDDMAVADRYGGTSLHEMSHGESFFALFMNRLGVDGLYLLDEPEAALSPQRQLALLARMHDLVRDGAQFIIATHSPILMAYPDATIYLLADGPPTEVAYRDTEHYTVTRNFLLRTEQMLDVLLDRRPDEGA